MEPKFCYSTTCKFCSHLRKKQYLKSPQHINDRLALIVARYERSKRPTRPAGRDGDWERDELRDNALSIGGI